MNIKFHVFKIIKLIISNALTNRLLVLLKFDNYLVKRVNPYLSFKPNEKKTLQEIAGFSHRPEIEEVLIKSHNDLKNTFNKYCPENSKVLDIGCGPGLYLKDFPENCLRYGLDISEDMIQLAKSEIPSGNFIVGSFIESEIPKKINLIYAIGMLIYIPPSQLEIFIKKIHDHLDDDGIFYLNYPHAIRFLDLFYPNLTYVQYSPNKIEKIASKYFKILSHHHAVDDRIVGLYDKTPYESMNPSSKRTYRNSYLLIAQKE